MESETINNLCIRLENGNLIEIQQHEYRKVLDKASKNYKKLIQSCKTKIKELTNATNEN